MELRVQCQFGQRKKHGQVIRPPTCQHRASGLFRVHFKRGKPQLMYLCAQCAFDKMPNRVKMLVPPEDAPDQTPKFFRDVQGCELVMSLSTDFTTEGGTLAGEGAKHWVEGAPKPTPRSRIVPVQKVVVTNRRKGKNLDMTLYLNTLRRHDDGK